MKLRMRATLTVLFLVFSLQLSAEEVSLSSSEFEAIEKAAQNSYGIDAAYEGLSTFVESNTQHRQARLLLARLQLLNDLPDETIYTLKMMLGESARHTHPDWQPWFWAGSAHLALGEVEVARDYLEVALSKNSRRVEVWVQLAVLEQEMLNHAGALQYLKIASQLAPGKAEIHLNRAYCLDHLGEYKEALHAYQQFLISAVTLKNGRGVRPLVLRRIAALSAANADKLAARSRLDRR